jgi:cbb3-type cytochrome oxidase maturation protein
MSMLYVLIPLALLVLAGAVWALVWAIKNRQFDDLDAQGWSVVLDDDSRPPGNDSDQDSKPPGKEGDGS